MDEVELCDAVTLTEQFMAELAEMEADSGSDPMRLLVCQDMVGRMLAGVGAWSAIAATRF